MNEIPHRSQTMVDEIGEIVSGQSACDIMAVFAWILGDVIVQTGADKEEVFHDFRLMVETATSMLDQARKGMPKGATLN